MRILVTGCVSRQANPKKNRRDVMVSWLLAECLRDLGHTVEHRDPAVDETFEEFDHIFLGLSAFHALGANRTYGVLAAFLHKGHDKTTFFVDDPDMGKIMTGIRSIRKDPERLFKEFFSNRLGYSTASQTEYKTWLWHAINLLHDYAWPTTIVPLFPWGDVEPYRAKLPNAVDLVGLDLSWYVPRYVGEDEWQPERKRVWVSETRPDNRWLKQQRPVYQVKHFGRGFDKRPIDPDLNDVYTKVWGVLDAGIPNGFFNSRILYAAQAGALYVTDWREAEALGDPYRLLPDTAAGFDDDTRTGWAMSQLTALHDATWSHEQALDEMTGLLLTKVNA